jgi:hypothetical protein
MHSLDVPGHGDEAPSPRTQSETAQQEMAEFALRETNGLDAINVAWG